MVSFSNTLTSSGDLWCAMDYLIPKNNHSSDRGREKMKALFGLYAKHQEQDPKIKQNKKQKNPKNKERCIFCILFFLFN